MLGQDPYPQQNIATGLLFGNKNNTKESEISPSLKIIKEAAMDYEISHYGDTFDITLESWAKQGVLLFNSALTVEMNKVGSHTMLWRPFISTLIKNISNYNTAIIYVLFGKQAKTFKPYINKTFNYIIEVEHPAYFYRNKMRMPYNIFKDINVILENIYGESIQWYNKLENN
jgi:uracil-DNA glycosylase